MTVPEIIDEQDAAMIAVVDKFKAKLEDIVLVATAKLQTRLHEALVLDAAGKIKRTRANAAVFRKLSDWFMEEMAQAGFVQLSRAFVNSFPGQLKYFDQIVEELAKQAGKSITFEWTPRDKKAFSDYASHAELSIETAVQNVATNVRSQILLSFGGLPLKQVAAVIAQKLDVSVERATTIADTAMVVFTRTAADEGYRKLDFFFKDLRYKYYGPLDKVTRPWCAAQLRAVAAGKTWTREELDALSNGSSLPSPVLKVGGGWACRHQYLAVTGSATA